MPISSLRSPPHLHGRVVLDLLHSGVAIHLTFHKHAELEIARCAIAVAGGEILIGVYRSAVFLNLWIEGRVVVSMMGIWYDTENMIEDRARPGLCIEPPSVMSIIPIHLPIRVDC